VWISRSGFFRRDSLRPVVRQNSVRDISARCNNVTSWSPKAGGASFRSLGMMLIAKGLWPHDILANDRKRKRKLVQSPDVNNNPYRSAFSLQVAHIIEIVRLVTEGQQRRFHNSWCGSMLS
jgi:hypothetical protein